MYIHLLKIFWRFESVCELSLQKQPLNINETLSFPVIKPKPPLFEFDS